MFPCVALSPRPRGRGTARDIFGQPYPYERRRVQHRGTAAPLVFTAQITDVVRT